VAGEVSGIVVATAEEAERRRFASDEGTPFKPFFDGDRVELFFRADVVRFLAAIDATIATHIDVVLADHRRAWFE
jgi:hypothetical protein